MNGSSLDSLLASLHGKRAQLRALSADMRLISTSAGLLRVYD
jgi:hypothetical protein